MATKVTWVVPVSEEGETVPSFSGWRIVQHFTEWTYPSLANLEGQYHGSSASKTHKPCVIGSPDTQEQNKKEWASSIGLCQRRRPQHPHHMKVSPWGLSVSNTWLWFQIELTNRILWVTSSGTGCTEFRHLCYNDSPQAACSGPLYVWPWAWWARVTGSPDYKK